MSAADDAVVSEAVFNCISCDGREHDDIRDVKDSVQIGLRHS